MNGSRVWFVVESGTDARLVDGLAERYETTVLARAITDGVAVSRPPEGGADVHIGPASRAGFAAWAAARILRATAIPDFVIAQGYGVGALLTQLACRHRIPVAMLVCSPLEEYYACRRVDSDGTKPFRAIELAGVRAIGRINARLGGRAFVLSEYLAQVLRGYGGRLRIDVVPVYGVDLDVFRPPDRPRPAIRAALGLPVDGPLILFSSRIAPEKDVPTLLDAFARVLITVPTAWLLHRSGEYREFERRAERTGVASRVIATDAVHPTRDLPASYQAADVCVQASRSEGLGFSVLEALACETPVMATGVGGLLETVVEGKTGWTCPPGDSSALARGIQEALAGPDEARRRASAGRRMVEERYERQHVFDTLTTLIQDAVGPRRD